MTPTLSATRHVHLDIELDPERQFHFRSRGQDGRRIALHRGDALTFTCSGPFSIGFAGPSPFSETAPRSHPETMLQSHEWFITAHVPESTPYTVFPYSVAVTAGDGTFEDHAEIVIECVEK